MKSLFVYRGNRIRLWLKAIRWIEYGLLFFPVILMLSFFIYSNLEWYVSIDYFWIGITLVFFFLSLGMTKMLQLYLEERFLFFKKVQRLWVFTRYLLDYRYYYEKKTSNGRTKIRFPKVYLKQNRYDLVVYLEMQGNKFQDKFKRIGGELETTFFMDFIERTYEEKYIVYRLAYSAFLNRIHAREVEYVEGKGIRLMKNVFWEFFDNPHLLVTGGTGGGKTVLLRSLLVAILKIGTVTIFDPKRADFVPLAELENLKGRVFYEKEDIISRLENEINIMNARYDFMVSKMKELGQKELGTWAKYGLKPHFIVADEWNAFVNSLGYHRDKVEDPLSQLVLKGRQAGCYVVIAMQKPLSDDLSTKVRASMMTRVSVGRLDDTGYSMTHGNENSTKEFRYVPYIGGKRVYGRGYISISGEVAQEFYSPLITPNFNFYDIFENYPRIENLYNPLENNPVESPRIYTRQETVEELNKLLGINTIKEYMVRKLYEAMVVQDYPFGIVDDKKVIASSDIEFMKSVLQMKESTPLDYEEIVQIKMEAS